MSPKLVWLVHKVRGSSYWMKLKRWAEARPCSLISHGKEFGFFLCTGKSLEGFKPERKTGVDLL